MDEESKIKQRVLQRIDKYAEQLNTATDMFKRTKDAGWGSRMAELRGRIDELNFCLRLIDNK